MSLTGKTGKYQDDIEALRNLPLTRYERIFKLFTQGVGGKQFYFYNLLNKIEFPDNIQPQILDLYLVKSNREPLTTTSFNIYEDIDSWWIIYLLNKTVIGNNFYAKGGQQLKYILPDQRGLIYQQITKSTVFKDRHF
jgi:hypothetical protein|tara:strand:- start:3040 stop:3450 length:411 start_codon:yes stop_codon:yes gene_type:complete